MGLCTACAPALSQTRLHRSIKLSHTAHLVPNARRRKRRTARQLVWTPAASQDFTADVAIVGGGIIGMCAARPLLERGLKVALIEQADELCAGATGAGQGYVWLAHRDPSNVAWQLATRSKQLWEDFVQEDFGAQSSTEWEQTGSILIGRTAAETAQLIERAETLRMFGVGAAWLDRTALLELEPALNLPSEGSGLLVSTDAQINGKAAAAYLMGGLHEAAETAESFHSLMGEQVEGVCVEPSATGPRVVGVRTSRRRIRTRRGVVVCAGAWTGPLLAAAAGEPRWAESVVPRRGLLLEVDRPRGMPPLGHGVMELKYTDHYARAGASEAPDLDITFTATRSASGKLLIGSSRELGGWDAREPRTSLARRILDHAANFIPAVSPKLLEHPSMNIREGHRPLAHRLYGMLACAHSGLPMVGPVEGAEGLWVASGHEGSGLTLGMATGELIHWHIVGQEEQAPFPEEMRELASALMPAPPDVAGSGNSS